jgi:diaminopimelate decarboxylase
MVLPDSAARTGAGHLSVGGCDLGELAATYGTPLYVYCETTIRNRLRAYRAGLTGWPSGGDILYAAKAYLSPAMVRILIDEDCGIDVVSGGELEIALRSGLDPRRAGFPGNNKEADEVAAAFAAGVGHLVIDSERELELVERVAGARTVHGLLRLSPGVKPDTHEFISTGQLDSKFGFGIETGQAMLALGKAMAVDSLDLRGVHMHIGSQIFNLDSYAQAVNVVADFLVEARRQHGFVAETFSAGGGLGIAYTEDDDPPAVEEFMRTVTESVGRAFVQRDLPLPTLLVEPGRSVVGSAGIALYTVGARKEIPGVRTYVSVDGGMGDNIRPKLYGARYQPMLVRAPDAPAEEVVTIAGRYCESTDILVRDCALPALRQGDVIAVPAAGAYNLAMASNYNASVRPAVLFVSDGRSRLVRRRETIDDLLRCEVMDGVQSQVAS